MDVVFEEDKSLANTGNAAENMSLFRRLSLNVIKTFDPNRGITDARRNATYEPSYLSGLLSRLFIEKVSINFHQNALSLFLELDKPMLKPLPLTPFVFAEWKKDRVKRCYHINVVNHWYSVPYLLVEQMMEIRITDKTVEIFHKGNLVATHLRAHKANGYTTNLDHLPPGHRSQAECTPEKLIEQAHYIGQSTESWIKTTLERPDFHPLQSLRTCLGVLRLAKQYNKDRLEKACKRAQIMQAFTFKSIESILQNGLDHQPLPQEAKCIPLPQIHEFVRGKEYYSIDEEGEKNVIESNH